MNLFPGLLTLTVVAISSSLHAALPVVTLSEVNATWQFANTLDETNAGTALTPAGTTPAYTPVTIAGKSDTALNLPALLPTASIQMPNAVGGNGGSVLGRTNAWSLVMDLKIPAQETDAALLQTDSANSDDAEAHVMGGPGLQFEYYEPGQLSVLPDFDALTPTATGTVPDFNLSPPSLDPPRLDDLFAFRYRGRIRIETPGSYTFYTTSDDGSQLLINGDLVVNNDGLHSAATRSGTVILPEGTHEIEVTFFEATGQAVLTAEYEGPGIPRQVIPASVLTHGNAGAIRLGADLIADPATIQLNKWHRLAITSEVSGADLLLKTYVDGVQTEIAGIPASVTKPLDGDWSLPSILKLFADDDGENQPLLVNSLSYWGGPLNDSQVAALGGPAVPGLPDLYVSSTSNEGTGSLRDHLRDVRNGGLISFNLGIASQTIPVGSGGPLTATKSVVIDADHLTTPPTIDGEGTFRAFFISAATTVSIRNLDLTGGFASTSGSFGGAIRNYGTLEVARCSIRNSSANVNGGGIMNEGNAHLTVIDTSISGNNSGAGGGVSNAGTATFERCTIHGNSARSAGGVEAINTTTLKNCTVTNNHATDGGGGGLATFGSLVLISCTVTENTANDFFAFGSEAGGGVLLDFLVTLTIENTIVAGNSSNLDPNDNIGAIEPTAVTILSFGRNLTTGNPLLEPLGDYGGPTFTMPPTTESRATARGIPTANTPSVDQRGLPRINALLDIGAVETGYEAVATPFEAWTSANIPAGQDPSFHGDPEGDGIENGREYAFRMAPMTWDPLLQPLAIGVPPTGLNRNLQIVIPYNATASDLIYILLESNDLQTYSEVWRYTVDSGAESITDPTLQTTIDPSGQLITITEPLLNPFTTVWKVGVELVP